MSKANVSHIFHRDWSRNYPVADRGEGIYIFDESGRRYIDAVGGVHVVTIGHGVREVADAMAQQAMRLAFPYSGSFSTRAELELAERVTGLAPRGFNKVVFVSGGSEANEMAFKIARKYQLAKGKPSRWRTAARWQSYHGSTMATLSASGKVSRRSDYQPYLLNFPHCPAPDPYRYGGDSEADQLAYGERCVKDIERVLLQEDPETIASLILEPITGAASGAVVAPPGYMAGVEALCRKHDIVLIADEVISGFGRTGANFAVDHWRIEPDIITCGKGIGSGYAPLGAVLIHDRVYETLVGSTYKSIFTGYTYSGHPVACAAGVAVLDIIERDGLTAKAAADGAWFIAQAQSLKRHSTVGEVRGKGLMIGIEFVADQTSRTPLQPPGQFARHVSQNCWHAGLIIRAETGTIDGVDGEHMLMTPPLIATRAELTEMLAILDRAISVAQASLRPETIKAAPGVKRA